MRSSTPISPASRLTSPCSSTRVVRQAYIDVDEQGTEAAAATGVGVSTTALIRSSLNVVVDQPFLFAITEVATGAPLFLGRVLDPSKH